MDNLAIRNKFNQKTTRNGSTVSDQIYLLPYLTEKTNPNAGNDTGKNVTHQQIRLIKNKNTV